MFVTVIVPGANLDLKKIAMQARNAEYNPKRFGAVIMRIRQPRTTALIFSSGKMVCTGAKSEEMSRHAARKFARIIQKLEFDIKFKEFKVSSTYVLERTDLNVLLLSGSKCSWLL